MRERPCEGSKSRSSIWSSTACRLETESVFLIYGQGSGVSAYGTPTKFKYIATNRVRNGRAQDGFLRSRELAPGNYIIKAFAADYAGNRATG